MDTLPKTEPNWMKYVKFGLPIGVCCVFIFLIILIFFTIQQKINRTFEEPKDDERTISLTAVSFDYSDEPLCNYFVKSSYNSCGSGDYTNDFVSINALKNAINHGCRLLDFEIYDLDNEPVVAVSSSSSTHFKGSFNSIPLAEVLKVTSDETTSGTTAFDPLFVSFRIQCEHTVVCNKVAKLIQSTFGERLLPPKYHYSRNIIEPIAKIPLKMFANKVVVLMDVSNPVIARTKLNEFVNIAVMSPSCRSYFFSDFAYNAPSDITDYTYTSDNLCICVPDGNVPDNFDSSIPLNMGVQFIAMQFQTNDDNLKLYNSWFEGYAFLKKNDDLKSNKMVVKDANGLPKEQSYSSLKDMLDSASKDRYGATVARTATAAQAPATAPSGQSAPPPPQSTQQTQRSGGKSVFKGIFS